MFIDSDYIEKYLTSGKHKGNIVFVNCPGDLMCIAPNCLKVEFDDVKCLNVVIDNNVESFFNDRTKGTGDFYKLALAQNIVAALVISKALRRVDNNKKADEIDEMLLKLFRYKGYAGEFFKNAPTQQEAEQLLALMPPFEINFFFDKTENEFLGRAVNEYMLLKMPKNIKVFCNNSLPSKYTVSGKELIKGVDYQSIDVINEFRDEQDRLPF